MELMGTFLQKDPIPQNAAWNLLISANNDYYDVPVDAKMLPKLQKGDKVHIMMDKDYEVTSIKVLENLRGT